MKLTCKVFTCVCLLFILVCCNRNQFRKTTQSQQSNEKTEINSTVAKIEIPYSGHSTEGGAITAYYIGAQLSRFNVAFYGESGNANYLFQLENDNTIRITVVKEYYKEPIGEVDGEVETDSKETILYMYRNNTLYRQTDGREEIEMDLEPMTVFNEAMLEINAAVSKPKG